MSSNCLIGCCGWQEARAKYWANFPVIELQDTFYEPPATALARKWKALAPPAFVFCMKAWQLITHEPKSPTYRRLKSRLSPSEHDSVGSFRPTEQVWLAWERTLEIAQALEAKVILFQCPKSFEPTKANLGNFERFFSQVTRGPFTLAWEPRGAWSDAFIRTLCERFDLLHCVDPFARRSVHGSPFYWRLHGHGGYRHRYSDDELMELRNIAGDAPGYILFNNVWMKEDARRFQAIGKRAPESVYCEGVGSEPSI